MTEEISNLVARRNAAKANLRFIKLWVGGKKPETTPTSAAVLVGKWIDRLNATTWLRLI